MLCNANTENTIRHNVPLMTFTSRVYIPYLLDTLTKWGHIKT